MYKAPNSHLIIITLFLLVSFAVAQLPTVAKADDKTSRAPLKKCWEYLFQDGAGQFISGFQDRVFISEAEGRLRAISAQSTETIWVSELGGKFTAIAPSGRNGILVLTVSGESNISNAGVLRLIDVESGLTKYSVAIGMADPTFLTIIGTRVVVASKNGDVEAHDLASGSSLWKVKVGGQIVSEPAASENLFAISTDRKQLEFYSPIDGSLLTTVSTEREMKELAFRSNQMLVAGDDRGNVTNYRDQTGSIWWKFKSGGRIGTIVETDAGILVGSYDNFVYLISKYSGDVKWKRRLDGRLTYRPLVAGKALVFTVSGEDDLVILDSENGKVLEQVAFGEGRYPVGESISLDRGILVFPLVGGISGFATDGCK